MTQDLPTSGTPDQNNPPWGQPDPSNTGTPQSHPYPPQGQHFPPQASYEQEPFAQQGQNGQQPFHPQGQQFPPQAAYGQPSLPDNGPPTKKKNTLGLLALITAIVGFIFACIPGALIVGWVLIPIAFVLSLVSMFAKGKSKKLSTAALITSIIGTIVGIIVFIAAMGSALDDAFSGGDVTVKTPDNSVSSKEGDKDPGTDGKTGENSDSEGKEAPAETAPNSRNNPYPVGTEIEQGDWVFNLNSVNLDATEVVAKENEFNDPPADGNVFILANITVKYVGTDPEGSMPWATVEYVTVDGNTINSYDTFAVVPEEFNGMDKLYEGASESGNIVFEVPQASAGEGVLAVNVEMFGSTQFFAVK